MVRYTVYMEIIVGYRDRGSDLLPGVQVLRTPLSEGRLGIIDRGPGLGG